ncbi:erythrocyte membrane protein 1, PfEMP1, putative [Plasmodium sp. gorilla clade G2]|uniref:erythrocyte membrane protein 1, PfEMP1, putative n=1 Tax=Plasmodium sp. gorilla clade G2 TaxID=880535 RepID=UPI000D26379C|nr:erythrocyte membrane protein 1, PfEMP1, putative [Plasmodium sp. gorilla clade G2]SOV20378.1 erythrocyte membrane protein 1, PfEMP1, putative [Plasmodium sp. gorilla clade G2]
MSGSSSNSFPPSNCQTISEFNITRGYSIDSTTTRRTASSSGSTSNNGEVEICMKYDKNNFDAGSGLGIGNDGNSDKEVMKQFISTINYDQSDFYMDSYKRGPCSVNLTNNIWIWRKPIMIDTTNSEIKDNSKYKNTIVIPPRTQSLCLGYLDKLNVNNIDDFHDNSRLLFEWIIAAKLEGQKLGNHYINNGDKLKKALGYSYADYGDLVKGTIIWENHITKQLETNLKHIFQTVFNKHIQQNGQTIGSGTYPKDLRILREAWWNTNKQYILGALIFGAQKLEGKNDSSWVEQMKNSPPTTDYIPQYLRFAQEWVEHLCEQRKVYVKEVIEKCKPCIEESDDYHKKNTIDNKKEVGVRNSGINNSNENYEGEGGNCWENNGKVANTSGECSKCKNTCEIFKAFVEGKAINDNDNKTWRERWIQMDRIYGDLIKTGKKEIEKYKENQRREKQQQQKQPQQKQTTLTVGSRGRNQPYMMKCGDNNECLKPDEDSFYQYLAYNGYTTLSSYMNLVLKDMDCGVDKPRWDRATVVKKANSGKTVKKVIYPQLFGSTPAGYKYACECRIPSREELCRDNHMYNTRWVCGQNSGSNTPSRQKRSAHSGQPTYVLCNLRHDENDESNHKDQIVAAAVPGVSANSALDQKDLEFFSTFDSWYKDIQDKLDRHFHRISRDCKLENIGTTSSGGSTGTISKECQYCRDNCECYKLWVKNMKDQWDKQKHNYEIFQKKSSSQNVSLNDYLFSRCWAEYFEKDVKSKSLKEIDAVQDIHIINLLRERCGEDKEKGQEKFQKRIEKAENETKICHKKQERCKRGAETLDCSGMDGNVSGCNDKYYDRPMSGKNGTAKNWICNGKDVDSNVCVPPRTQTLCVANMYNSTSKTVQLGNSGDELKKYIKNAMRTETELLYEYYKEGTPIVTTKGETNKSVLPKNFCKAAERTYNDFKHMVIGDIPWKPDSFKNIHNRIKQMITHQENNKTPQTNNSNEPLEEWWEKNSDEFWEAVKCGIKDKPKNGGGIFSGNECGEFPPDDTDNQFVWWFKEWGQQFCIQRQKYIKDINENCSSSVNSRCNGVSGGKSNELTGDCKTKCEAYKNFINDRKKQWKQQKNKYERENPGMFAEELLGHDYPECVDTNFELIFEENNTQKSTKSKEELKYPYGDASDICSCEQQTYECKGSASTCKEKSGDISTWRTHLLKIGRDNKKLEGVYAPPRRQKLCLANLYPINFGKDTNITDNDISRKKNEIFNRLKIVAEREAFYLWKQYHKNDKDDEEAHKKACCAIRSSFFDIADIVKGIDLWDDASKKYIDKTLKEIFQKELEELKKTRREPKYENPILYLRKIWWDSKKNDIWDAMQCGVTNALELLNVKGKTYENIDCMKDINNQRNVYLVATPQFVRWLEEWSQRFCERYNELINDVETKCGNSGNNNDNFNDNSNNGCKDACAKYNDWISLKRKEWNGMSKYYENVKGKDENSSPDFVDYGAVSQPTAMDYLNQKCNQTINGTNNCCYCENVGTNTTSTATNPLNHMDNVVNKIDDKYKQYMAQCTRCYIQHIKDQINTIEQKIQGRQDQNTKGKSSSSSNNPCTNPSGITPTKTVDVIAKEMQDKAKTQLGNSSGLVGNISLAEFKNSVKGNTLMDTDICNLDKKTHTNDHRGDGEPCKGKGGDKSPSIHTRFVVGVRWEADPKYMHPNHKDVIMPPRRRHICTSNLENLYMKYEGLTGTNVNHSFFGDVLLTAKEEANKIIDMYKEKNNRNGQDVLNDPKHQQTICRAVRGSFADLGDIIRGRDLWSKEDGAKKMEEHFVNIFKNIKEKHSDNTIKVNDKYTETNKYKQLREDWWEANRDKIWEAMKCGISAINCDKDTPHDDYIPQRLRWMTEWTEWFCKAQKDEYNKVRTACDKCKSGQCTECNDCQAKCTEYQTFVNEWKKQWTYMETKYQSLYKDAKNGKGSDENEKYLNEFLQKLRTANSGNTTYTTAAGYVHEELKNMECERQNEFCKIKPGGTQNEDYAFEQYPKDYKQACGCQEDTSQTTSQQTPTSTPVAPNYSQGSEPGTTPSPAAVVPHSGGSSQDGTQTKGPYTSQEKGKPQARSGGAVDNGQVPKPQDTAPQDGNQSHGSGRQVPGGNLPTQDPKQTGSNAGEPHGAPGSQPSAVRADPGKDGQNGQQTNTVPSGSPVAPGGQGNSDPVPGKSTNPADEFKELDECPFENGNNNVTATVNNVKCKNLTVNSRCTSKKYDNNLNNWNADLVKNNKGDNQGVLMPPRRVYLCRKPFFGQRYHSNEKDSFIKDFYTATFNQGILLGILFNDNKDEAYESLKNSFYDYGDIIKGTDMIEETLTNDLNDRLIKMFPKNSASSTSVDGREQWWTQNRTRVWHNMLCGYHKGVTDPPTSKRSKKSKAASSSSATTEIIPLHWCKVPDDDSTPQFLRWMTEWARQFCEEKGNETISLEKNCLDNDAGTTQSATNGGYKLTDNNCISSRTIYKDWLRSKNDQWKAWEKLYDKYEKEKVDASTQSVNSPPGTHPQPQALSRKNDAEKYVQRNCGQCKCNINNLDKMYEQIHDTNINSIKKIVANVEEDIPQLKLLKEKDITESIEKMLENVSKHAKIIEEKINPEARQLNINTAQSNNSQGSFSFNDLWKAINETVLPRMGGTVFLGTYGTIKAIEATPGIISKGYNYVAPSAKDAATTVVRSVLSGLKGVITSINATNSNQNHVEPPAPEPPTPPQNDQSDITHNILSSTLPVGISFALGSIALLFYLKKIPKTSPVDLVRVLDIPQNDYNIPDETSTNRYVPYSKYKGKTYIYVERDGDSEDDKYMFTSDTTDVTSSESEYDELDINDIYPYRSPKYKTLIEVVLKPSNKTTYDDTYKDNIVDTTYISSDNPTYKLTDNEWNELKKDFISQYLENDNMDVPNENIIDDNMDMQPNTTHDSMEEKPFITQIQDRKLYSDDNEIIYNINWNIPENITTNTATYVSPNIYSGIDLINDSLNSGNDIYDELLKRKENELYGTKYTKNTTTNKVAKPLSGDPILNQLDLFDKWLDRHRDMCNEWNNKEEMLHKLNDEWNKENNQHIMNISSPHNDMNDEETYNVINTHESNDITFLENLGSTNIQPNDITRNNNALPTNNLRTNIYMDIHYNENNDIPSNDNLENSYNSS